MLGTRLASRLGLPTAAVRVVEVPEELIRLTAELCIETPRTCIPCASGLQFGSRYPVDPRHMTLHDFLPDAASPGGRMILTPQKSVISSPCARSGQWARGLAEAAGEMGRDALERAAASAAERRVRSDLDTETERLYADHGAPERPATRVGAAAGRGQMRSYCSQVLRRAGLWERVQKGMRAEEFTFPGDPMRIDYGYRRNGTRGFVQTLSVTRAPGDVKSFAYIVERIRDKVKSSEFTAVTDVHLIAEDRRHRFVQEMLRDADVEAVPMEGFAVWAAKMRPLIQ